MEVDGEKKRKIEEVQEEPENLDLEQVLKDFIENNTKLAKVIAVLAQKTLTFEKMFNKDLFK